MLFEVRFDFGDVEVCGARVSVAWTYLHRRRNAPAARQDDIDRAGNRAGSERAGSGERPGFAAASVRSADSG